MRVDEETRRIELGVKDLVPAEEADPFASARGGFARLVAGVRAHVAYAAAQLGTDPEYRREVSVRGELVVDGWTVSVFGRIDGLRATEEGVLVEEVKTVILPEDAFLRLDPAGYPAYVLQLRIYLLLLASAGPASGTDPGVLLPRGSLVFVNLPGGRERAFAIEAEREAVRALVEARVREILTLWQSERERLEKRRAGAASLPFPFPERRRGQAELEEDALRAFDAGECLLATAPPGLGKTAAVLSAALRHALANDRRVFFVTSKTTEQRVVSATLARLTAAHPGLSAVVLQAKAKICPNEVVVCHPDFCEYARDYPAKVNAAGSRELLLAAGLASPERVLLEGLRSRACPFELELDLTERADVVVGDYNYVFDPAIALRREFDEGPSDDLVLVIDEAHNLLDRAREYYSPVLDSGRLRDLLLDAVARPGDVWRAIEEWVGSVLALFDRLKEEAGEVAPIRAAGREAAAYPVGRALEAIRFRRTLLEGILVEYLALRRASGSVLPDDPVLEAAFAFMRFARVMELEGDEFVYLYEPAPTPLDEERALFRILCLDPSRHLGRRLRSFHAVVAMSATLSPESYYRDLLGFPKARTTARAFPSPFPRENRRVLVVPTVSTTWRERARFYDETARTIGELVEAHPAHWIAFLPSFAYLREIDVRLGRLAGERLVQREGMSEPERADVLARLEMRDGTPRLLLAVLGGIFAEGIDLPGESVEGVIVVSPGLPAVSIDRDLLRRKLEEEHGAGFEYAYLVPGLNRVIQAAGRLVRSETDRGVVVLLDRRFADAAYHRLLPRDWYDVSISELVVRDPAAEVSRFFGREPE